MHAEDLADAEAVHQPVLDHFPPAAAPLFRGLENHDRSARKIAGFREIARGSQQHGGMPVMAAGMHLSGYRRLVGEIAGLLYGKGIHVCPKPNCLSLGTFASVDDPYDAGSADTRHNLVAAKRFQFLSDRAGRALDIEHQLRVCVQIASPSGDLGVQISDAVNNGHDILRTRVLVPPDCSKSWAARHFKNTQLPIDRAENRPYTGPRTRPVKRLFPSL